MPPPALDYKLRTRLSNCNPSMDGMRPIVQNTGITAKHFPLRLDLLTLTMSRTKTAILFSRGTSFGFRTAAYLVFWLVIRLSVAARWKSTAPSDDTTFVCQRNIVALSPVGLSLNLGSKYVNSDIHKESVHSGWRNVSPSIQLNQGDNARG